MTRALVLSAILTLSSGCMLDRAAVQSIVPGQTRGPEVVERLGRRPDEARAIGAEELWIFLDRPPLWPLFIPIVNIGYSIYFELATSPQGVLRLYLREDGVVRSGIYEGREVIRLEPSPAPPPSSP